MKCAWCSEEAVGTVILEPERYKVDRITHLRVLAKSAIVAQACKDHLGIVDRQPLFYSCGCNYEKGFDTCPMHNRRLRRKPRQNVA